MEMTAVPRHNITSSELLALRSLDERNQELRARNEARILEVKAAMGSKWVLHPSNAPAKQANNRVLG